MAIEAYLAPGIQRISELSGLRLSHGRGVWLWDSGGQKFLDLYAGVGVASIGHAHPRWVEAITKQLTTLATGSFTTDVRERALERLHAHLPGDLAKSQYYSGGAEAVESAMRLARSVTGRRTIVGIGGGFHGKTEGVLGFTTEGQGDWYAPMEGKLVVPYPFDPLSCSIAEAAVPDPRLSDFTEQIVASIPLHQREDIAGILVEPMLGTAGNLVPPSTFLSAVSDAARQLGALLLVDEMITGLGRTGHWFAFERECLVPDVLIAGKGLGGGYPVTAVSTWEKYSRATPWGGPSGSSTSFGGNPLAAAASSATISVLEEECAVSNAAERGRELRDGLSRLSRDFPFVANVRGEGLFVGFDLVDRGTGLLANVNDCQDLFHECLSRGLLAMTYAPRVRLTPPLIMRASDVEMALDRLESSFRNVARRGAFGT